MTPPTPQGSQDDQGALATPSEAIQPDTGKSLTVDAGAMLGDYQFNVSLENSVPKTHETVLVAPNKRIQKQWEKEYPGIKVILAANYKGYPVPAGLVQFGVTDLQPSDQEAK